MRIYTLHDFFGNVKVKVKQDKCCLFCDHCTDVFWDYENGPYWVVCELDNEHQKEHNAQGKCENFIESEDDVYDKRG